MKNRPTQSDKEKFSLEIEKLKRENAKLEREETTAGRIATTIVPLITTFVAFLGVGLSLLTLYQQKQDKLQDAHDRAFQQALNMATDAKGGADRRISGIYQLGQFWLRKDEAQIVGATITSLLLLPENVQDAPRVRCAAAEVVAMAYEPNMPKQQMKFIRTLLFGEASSGRTGLISLQNLKLAHDKSNKPDEDPATANRYCSTPLAATREAIRKGWRDLRDTNLQSTNLDGAELYQADLYYANLSNSSVKNTNLHCANLAMANSLGTILTDAQLQLTNVPGPDQEMVHDQFAQLTAEGAIIAISNEAWQDWKLNSDFDGDMLLKLLPKPVPRVIQLTDAASIRYQCYQ
jgi:hypothetical protein